MRRQKKIEKKERKEKKTEKRKEKKEEGNDRYAWKSSWFSQQQTAGRQALQTIIDGLVFCGQQDGAAAG